jgi:hypothetical protein
MLKGTVMRNIRNGGSGIRQLLGRSNFALQESIMTDLATWRSFDCLSLQFYKLAFPIVSKGRQKLSKPARRYSAAETKIGVSEYPT